MQTALDPDADVLTGLMSGDERALSELMRRHLGRVHRVCARILGDSAMAEDVAQSVFLKTWTMAPNWVPGRARLLSWMLRVATNQCFDILKKKAPIYTDDVPDMADDRASADIRMISGESATQVQDAVNALPPRQKAALTLSYYEEVSQREGAEILGVTESAYESLLVRARKSLKTNLLNDPDFAEKERKSAL